ncbi:glycosyl hydrolase, putative [Trichomonas vaginalis G3]|uniref:Glycosyl hydrolase, putative n=1 Tax=Trichomonas vaginalis (strain ATCC PRA-98 / G3) TaxID=412133 RepID=A2DN59_TRIV3|nr:alpha-mannosidase 2C1 family [Trichomonas vaginalis G3]EAY18236.1 glycosyl hydrolase, putative [Trichomonas vaginalis G3]KAI5491547.1 alpha-mannosidase 2C1 family [Trichomonas vaginalis G3]|eukprot:XP_001579222.1 glycosyl hydrolase [Trichomonas vaginalis G3]
MKSINIGCLVDSSVGIVKFINTVTRNTINPYYYHALSGPMKYNFVQYDQTKENDYAIVLLVVDPSRPLTKQEEQNILNKLPQNAPRAVVTINQSDASIGIMKDIDPLFSITINTNTFDGVDMLLYQIAQYTMKDPNVIYDMPHILDKFEKYLALIDLNRVISFTPATNTQVCKDATASFKIPSSEASYKREDFDNRNGYQFGKLQYHWIAFKGKIALPPSYDPKKHVIRAKFGIDKNYLEDTNDDNNPVGPEGRIWLNGQPLGAVDSFHDSHVITEGGEMEVRIFTGRCWTNHHLSQFGVEITERNTEAIYYRLKFLDRVIDKLSDSNPDKIRLIRTVDAAVRSLDVHDSYENGMWDIRIHDPNSTAFYASVPQCLEILRSIAYMRPSNANDDHFSISMIGYNHLDTVWQWPYAISHFKSANTITSMLHLIENPPDEFKDPVKWQYLATASQHYKWLKEDDPDLFERVKSMANDKKRWIVDGVSWLEHECVVLNGESMIRQMLYGEKFFTENLNAEQTCLFLPDCFGFSAALPQVLQGFGIDAFITSKISWSEYNDFPYHTFVWKGNDGSEVLSHFISDPASWNPKVSMYTGTATVSELLGTYQSYKQRDICPHSALTTVGNGDGGGGLTEEMIWNLNLLNEFPQISQVPKVQFPTLKSLFEEIRQQKNLLPVWDGELYLEYHRGTQTTMEETKRQVQDNNVQEDIG